MPTALTFPYHEEGNPATAVAPAVFGVPNYRRRIYKKSKPPPKRSCNGCGRRSSNTVSNIRNLRNGEKYE